MTTSFDDIVDDPEIQIVVELIGGIRPALEFQLRALKAGKHVVTANKQLISQHGAELFDAAERPAIAPALRGQRRRRRARHQGAARVAGGGRGERDLRHRQRHDQLHAERDDRDRAPTTTTCSRRRSELGYAEADPTEDVGGKDAAAKMAILSSIAFHSRTSLADVPYEGITA